MPALFGLFVAIVIIVVIISLIVWLFGYVTIIPAPVKQIIVSLAALFAIVYLIGVLVGVVTLPNFF